MGGTKLYPAKIIRTLVDTGKIEETIENLPAPWNWFEI